LDDSKEFHLDDVGKVADLIKKQGADVRTLEPTGLVAQCSREGASFMTEQFVFR
jgi:hypothetical protein